MAQFIPERGDIVIANFNPVAGHEQAKTRPAIVLSSKKFNQRMRLALVAPITSRVRGHGFEVVVDEGEITGAVLCHQVRTIDYRARSVRLVEKSKNHVMQEALAKVRAILN